MLLAGGMLRRSIYFRVSKGLSARSRGWHHWIRRRKLLIVMPHQILAAAYRSQVIAENVQFSPISDRAKFHPPLQKLRHIQKYTDAFGTERPMWMTYLAVITGPSQLS